MVSTKKIPNFHPQHLKLRRKKNKKKTKKKTEKNKKKALFFLNCQSYSYEYP